MPSPKKVLLVDDSEELLELHDLILSQRGYETRTATSVDAAVGLIRDFRPNVVITDIVMPEKSGFELITWVQSNLAPPLPCVVALSGFRDAQNEALRRGAAAFRVKPIQTGELLQLVADAFEHRHLPSFSSTTGTVQLRRRAAAEAAEAAVAAVLADNPNFVERVRSGTRLLSRYFDHSVAAVLVFSREQLRVLCSSDPSRFPDGAPAGHLLRQAVDVIASGSSFVVPDSALATALGVVTDRLEPQPFASVPMLSREGAVIGNIAVFGDHDQSFDAVDLTILEHIARHAAIMFFEPDQQPLAWMPGVLREHHWHFLLQCELGHLHQARAMTVALFDTTEDMASDVAARIAMTLSARTALARIGDQRFGLFALAGSVEAGRRAVTAAMVNLGEAIGLRTASMVTLTAFEPPNEAGTLLDLVEAGLRAAERRGPGTVISAVIRQEITSADAVATWARSRQPPSVTSDGQK